MRSRAEPDRLYQHDETAVYSTGMIPDPDLKQMLKDSGAEFSGQALSSRRIPSQLSADLDPAHRHLCCLGQYLPAHDEEHGRP